MVKIYTPFQTKTAQKPYPLGRHIPDMVYTGVPSPPGPVLCLLLQVEFVLPFQNKNTGYQSRFTSFNQLKVKLGEFF